MFSIWFIGLFFCLLVDCGGVSWISIGDSGEQQSVGQVSQSLRCFANNTDFAILLGDNFYDDGVDSVADPLFETGWRQPFAHQLGKNTTWFAILGNHDSHKSRQAQIDYHYLHTTNDYGRWFMPSEYYSVVVPITGIEKNLRFDENVQHNAARMSLTTVSSFNNNNQEYFFSTATAAAPGGVAVPVTTEELATEIGDFAGSHLMRMIMLDTFHLVPEYSLFLLQVFNSPSSKLAAKQLQKEIESGKASSRARQQIQWLKSQLELPAKWIVVVGHYPLYSVGGHGVETRLQSLLSPILRTNHVDLYLSGHDHNVQHFESDGVQYIVSGSASRLSPTYRPAPPSTRLRFADGKERSFLRHSLEDNGDSLLSQVVNDRGEIKYSFRQQSNYAKRALRSESIF